MENADIANHTPIYILEDWEEDVWKRCYFTIQKNAVFCYTLDRREAQKKRYPYSLGEIHSSVLKNPKSKLRGAPVKTKANV